MPLGVLDDPDPNRTADIMTALSGKPMTVSDLLVATATIIALALPDDHELLKWSGRLQGAFAEALERQTHPDVAAKLSEARMAIRAAGGVTESRITRVPSRNATPHDTRFDFPGVDS